MVTKSKTNNKKKIIDRVININYDLEKGPMTTMFKECVGGPGTAGAGWEIELIEFCKENDVCFINLVRHL